MVGSFESLQSLNYKIDPKKYIDKLLRRWIENVAFANLEINATFSLFLKSFGIRSQLLHIANVFKIFFVICWFDLSFFFILFLLPISLTSIFLSRCTSADSATLITSNFHLFDWTLMQNVVRPMQNDQLYLRLGIIYPGTIVQLGCRMPCMTTCTKANTIENWNEQKDYTERRACIYTTESSLSYYFGFFPISLSMAST